MRVYHTFSFSIWPPVAVNILYFLVHAIDDLGGGYRRNTLRRKEFPPNTSEFHGPKASYFPAVPVRTSQDFGQTWS